MGKMAAYKLNMNPSDLKFCAWSHQSKGEMIAGLMTNCYPASELPQMVVLFDDSPSFAASARDYGLCSSRKQQEAIRKHGATREIIAEGIESCEAWKPPLKPARASLMSRGCYNGLNKSSPWPL